MPIEVRRLTAGDDLALAGDIVRASYDALDGYRPDAQYRHEIGDVAGRIGDTVVLGAFDGGRLVGCLTFVPGRMPPYAEHDDPEASSFRYFGVAPDAQGRGVGEAMVRRVIDETRAHGRSRVFIHTIPAMHAARRLYERLGFVRAPEGDAWWDDVQGIAYVLHLDRMAG